jgi:hypothetical protein
MTGKQKRDTTRRAHQAAQNAMAAFYAAYGFNADVAQHAAAEIVQAAGRKAADAKAVLTHRA